MRIFKLLNILNLKINIQPTRKMHPRFDVLSQFQQDSQGSLQPSQQRSMGQPFGLLPTTHENGTLEKLDIPHQGLGLQEPTGLSQTKGFKIQSTTYPTPDCRIDSKESFRELIDLYFETNKERDLWNGADGPIVYNPGQMGRMFQQWSVQYHQDFGTLKSGKMELDQGLVDVEILR